MTDVIAGHAVEFLSRTMTNRSFLYLAFNGPYGLGGVVQHPTRTVMPRITLDKHGFLSARGNQPAPHGNRAAMNTSRPCRSYAAAVSGVDDGVGRVDGNAKRLNLDTNTLVVFRRRSRA